MKEKTAQWLARNSALRVMPCQTCPWFLIDPAHCKQITANHWFALCMQVMKAKRVKSHPDPKP